MIKIGIAEDEDVFLKQTQEYIERFAKEYGEEITVSSFKNGGTLAFDYHPVFDILLLDISMPGITGMEAAKMIRDVDEEVVIIFITSLAKYAIKGYEVKALDFVLKPVGYYQFASKLAKAVTLVKERSDASLLFSGEDGVIRLRASEIIYAEVRNHRVYLHTKQGDYSKSGSLSDIEQKLQPHFFSRCNKCYLVNLRHIERYTPTEVYMSNGDVLQISRPRKKEFQQIVMKYYGGVL